MKIIITMAGEGKRFKDIGILKPKHEILANGKTLFEWSLISLTDFFLNEFVFIVRRGMYNKEFIVNKCHELGICKFTIKEIDKITDGQAETCLEADDTIVDDEAIIIYNIDTYIEIGQLLKKDISEIYSGFIPVFKGSGNKWSFVKIDSEGKVVEVTEKERISDLCSIGFYYFNSWKNFKNIYLNFNDEIKSKYKEIYIAPMYQYMIDEGDNIGVVLIDTKSTHILGTPEDIHVFDKDFK